MQIFRRELASRNARGVDAKRRRWFYVPYDQLTADVGPLASANPREVGLVLIEAAATLARRPYHKQRLALLLANQRHFALEQVARGVVVRYVVAPGGPAEALTKLAGELGSLRMMEAAERELRVELSPLVARGVLEVHPHAGWLTTRADFLAGAGDAPPWRMDAFYRHVRHRTGILMKKNGKPAGARYSFDVENRERWRGEPPAPPPPCFEADAVTHEVAELVQTKFAHHPGTLDLAHLPATKADAESLWRWAKTCCAPHFGPYEDAMSTCSTGLFHTRVSALLNLHRLLPARLVREIANDEGLPLASREGFVRQILGWREFVRHVHVETDGFRRLSGEDPPLAAKPGDGGFGRWRRRAWPASRPAGDGGARPSRLEASEPIPPAFWGEPSGLACLDHVVADVWREGWSHHITRLMILANLATLLAVDPRELTDWFWAAYVDAYDWVVEPNVLAMGSFATGDLMTTKPYVSGAAYIARMSDYCERCAFDPRTTCPITRLYWAFVARHAERFARHGRLAGAVASVRRRPAAERREDARQLRKVRETLLRAEVITPASLVRGRGRRRGRA